MRLSRPQQAAYQRILSLRGSHLPADAIGAEVGAALEGAIGFDGFRLFAVEPRTGAIERLLAASSHDAEYRLLFLRDAYSGHQPEFLAPLGLARPFRELPRSFVVGTTLAECFGVDPAVRLGGDPLAYDGAYQQATDLYRARIDHPDGMLHCIFHAGPHAVAVMHMYRITRWRAHLTATQVAFMAMLGPVIGETLAEAMHRETTTTAETAGPIPDASGVLVVDQTGRVDFASPAGRAWLALLGTAENDLATGVPTSVWSAMAGLRTMDATTGHAAGTGPVLSVGYRGGRARIESTPGASPDQVAMVISAEAPGRGTDWVAPADLTPAETRITRLVVEGLSNRQIADRLALSENTVQWHLRHIYGKLDVRNRAQLVTRHRVPA